MPENQLIVWAIAIGLLMLILVLGTYVMPKVREWNMLEMLKKKYNSDDAEFVQKEYDMNNGWGKLYIIGSVQVLIFPRKGTYKRLSG